jgi:hypothetical protein
MISSLPLVDHHKPVELGPILVVRFPQEPSIQQLEHPERTHTP